MADAFDIPAEIDALPPMATLLLPVAAGAALVPINTLSPPVVKTLPEFVPIRIFEPPVVRPNPALLPKMTL
jgi:hypothetical protein